MSVADDASRSTLTGSTGDDSSPPSPRPSRAVRAAAGLRPHAAAAIPGLIAVALMIVWAGHDGGFDDDTWYWGALGLVALLASVVVAGGATLRRLTRPAAVAVGLFGAYAVWSYASIAWAQAPGLALNGSNRTLLYAVMLGLMALLPWTAESARAALLTFAIGVGVIAVVLLFRLASDDNVAAMLSAGRMNTPTGYYNATAALFSIDALVCIGLAARRGLPGPIRGLLLALAGAALQLAVTGQSRGWLFTLPIVVAIVAVIARDRLRMALAAVIPVTVALIPVRALLRIYDVAATSALHHTAAHAGQMALLLLVGAFVLGTLGAWVDQLGRIPGPGPRARRVIGALAVAVVLAGGAGGAVVVSHGSPFAFIARQWRGFSHPQTANTVSHFSDVGSGRYDFWRVSLDAFAAHPIGGLGQDNFEDYYMPRRRTSEEPAWTHSLELRLLAHTGGVGFLLFAGVLVMALVAAMRNRRRGTPAEQSLAAIALFPLVVWAVYGSVDWFWEIPALSGPALGFLGIATAVGHPARAARSAAAEDRPRPAAVRVLRGAAGLAGLIVVVAALAFPYLSVREVSIADDIQASDPRAALAAFSTASNLNPWSAVPGRLAGAVALSIGENRVAAHRFAQSIAEEPGGWFAWLGAGLAASALGDRRTAEHDFRIAYAIDRTQPAVAMALARVNSPHPLTATDAFRLLIVP